MNNLKQSSKAPATMDCLPPELIGLILAWEVRISQCDKNSILNLRLVCKKFNQVLKGYAFATIQLEFSRFLKAASKPDTNHLVHLGGLSNCFYLDMMVMRDEAELVRLSEVFRSLVPRVPEMAPLLASLKKYCMSRDTFDENDFRMMIKGVVDHTPNLSRLKLTLPFQVVGQHCTTATLLLATTFSVFAKRPEEHKRLDTLVLDHVSDTTINTIFNNHMDVANAIKAFAGLKHLIMSIKRQEASTSRQELFTKHLWFLIRKAVDLESMCIIGWNAKRNIKTRRNHGSTSISDWAMKSLSHSAEGYPGLKRLRYLELKRVDIDARSLFYIIEEASETLKEVYLIEVYMKVMGIADELNESLWIGQPDTSRSTTSCWLAADIRCIKGLNLDIFRATCLGYDDYHPVGNLIFPDYDLIDPTGQNRSFDERFVDAVCGHPGSAPSPSEDVQTSTEVATRELNSYDAYTYQREIRNPTSAFKSCIDGHFMNHNEQALKELQTIINVADRGMTILTEELNRAREVGIDQENGLLVHGT